MGVDIMSSVKASGVIDGACLPSLVAEPLSPEAAERMAAALRVLGDPARLRLLSLIAACPEGEICQCKLTEPLGLSQPTVSHHLKVLVQAGLLEREQRGRWAYFRVVPESFELLRESLVMPEAAAR